MKFKRTGWSMVAAHFATLWLVLGSAYDTGSVFFPSLVRTFGWRRSQVGLLFSSLGAAMTLASPLVGWLLDRLPAQWVVAAGASLVATSMILASDAHNFPVMLVAFMLMGVGLGGSAYVPAAFVISNWFTERRGLALGITLSGEGCGGALMTLAVTRVITTAGWRTGYQFLAAPILAIVVPWVLLVVRTRPERSQAEDSHEHESLDLPGLELSAAMATVSFWLIAFAEAGYGFYVTAVFVHLAEFALQAGYNIETAGLFVVLVLVIATVMNPLIGLVADRTAARQMIGSAYVINALGLLTALLIALKDRVSGVYMAVFLFLFGLVLQAPLQIPLIIADCFGYKNFGSISGFMGMCYTAGLSVGPFVAGLIFDVTKSYADSFAVCVVVSVLCAIAIWCTTPLCRELQ